MRRVIAQAILEMEMEREEEETEQEAARGNNEGQTRQETVTAETVGTRPEGEEHIQEKAGRHAFEETSSDMGDEA